MQRLRFGSWLLAFVFVLAVAADVTGLIPEAKPWARDHPWFGYLLSALVLAVLVAVLQQRVHSAGQRERLQQQNAAIASLTSENDFLRRRVEGFAPSSSPETRPGAPVLSLDKQGYVQDEDMLEVVYCLSNWSEYAISGLVIQSATPDVEVVGLSHAELAPMQAGEEEQDSDESTARADHTVVTVRFRTSGGETVAIEHPGTVRRVLARMRFGRPEQRPVTESPGTTWRKPWVACITYTASDRHTRKQEVS